MVRNPLYTVPVMPRKRYPHLPIRPKLYEGINPPSSQKTLLTVRQINTFYDAGNPLWHTRKALRQAELTPSAFGPTTPRNGQPPMLFRAGDAKRAVQMANQTLDTPPLRPESVTVPSDTVTFSTTIEVPEGVPGLTEFGLITEQKLPGMLDHEWQRYQRLKAAAEGAVVPDEAEKVPYGFTERQWRDYSQAEAGVEPDEEHATPSDAERLRESVEITFNAVVDDESCDDLLQKITEAIDGGAKDITLWISSEGGSLFSALGMYDRLRYLQRTHNITLFTVATGYVLSAGTILMAAGARRYSLPHTVFMLHEPYQMPWESGEDAKVLVTEIGERQELHELSLKKIAHIFYERDSRPEADEEAWLDIFRVPSKKYFGADEALQWGLVDALL